MRWKAGLALLLCTAGAPAHAGPTPAETAETAALAPFPFTPEQIRDGCPEGRKVVYALTTPAGSVLHAMVFGAGTEAKAHVQSASYREGESPQWADSAPSWAELQLHASYPRDSTEIHETSVTVPAGTFASLHYVVTGEDGKIAEEVWFAKDLPGPPAKRIAYTQGATTTMTMVQSGRATAPKAP